jgi:hypothetical protein
VPIKTADLGYVIEFLNDAGHCKQASYLAGILNEQAAQLLRQQQTAAMAKQQAEKPKPESDPTKTEQH